jgi:hypothetical protein
VKGDFSRDTFDAGKHFSRVLMQQGRVTLDSDYNEQSSIGLHQLRTTMRDLIGPFGAPREGGGFRIQPLPEGGLGISSGRYYVDGILVENEAECRYDAQPHGPLPLGDPLADRRGSVLIYLDVWERHVTALDDAVLRDVALGGPDTCSRAQVVWQVRSLRISMKRGNQATSYADEIMRLVSSARRPQMAARASQYRGSANQLYRVEVHRAGEAGAATFKWSRDNGAIASAWTGGTARLVQVSDVRPFKVGGLVELVDDTTELQGAPGQIVKVANVEPDSLVVEPASATTAWKPTLRHPKARRWDHDDARHARNSDGAIAVQEGAWISIERDIEVSFAPSGQYRTGDYWLIPARAGTQAVEWPLSVQGEPVFQPPRGIAHYYARSPWSHGTKTSYKS